MSVAMHGHDDGLHQVGLALRRLPDQIERRQVDCGRPFDLPSAPASTRPATLAEARPGGLGVHLMRSFARKLTYERRGLRNHLTLVLVPALDCRPGRARRSGPQPGLVPAFSR